MKINLVKLSLKPHFHYVKLLLLGLFRLQALPKQHLFISHFELMYGGPVLTLGLSPKFSPLLDHLLTSLVSHLLSPMELYWPLSTTVTHYLLPPTYHLWRSSHSMPSSPLPIFLSPKLQGPSQLLSLRNSYWVCLPHLKSLTPPPQNNSSFT